MAVRRMSGVLCAALATASCAEPQFDQAQAYMVTRFYDMSDASFSIRALAPAPMIRELAICKGIWLAEKAGHEQVSFSNPVYDDEGDAKEFGSVPEGWAVVRTTMYRQGVNPDGNPPLAVAEWAARCRADWDWYR